MIVAPRSFYTQVHAGDFQKFFREKRMFRRVMWMLLPVMVAGLAAFAQERGGERTAPDMPLAKQEALVTANQAAFVIVEYTLQYDKGEAPQGSAFTERCPFCGEYHSEDLDEILKDERPLERPGILIDATHVVAQDMQLHPRFVKEIKVRRFDSGRSDGKSALRVGATISAYPKQQNAIILELSGKLEGAKPATFDTGRNGPFSALWLDDGDGRWAAGVQSFGGGLIISNGKPVFIGPRGLIVDKEGIAVGISTGLEMPADGSWKADPAKWPAWSAGEMKESLANVESRASRGIVPVTLNFRSPKVTAGSEQFSDRHDEQDSTVKHVLGVVADEHTVLVLSDLKPSVTARLERIRLQTEPPTEAKFKASLKDYGILVATTDSPLTGGPPLSRADVVDLRGAVIAAADILMQGEKRVEYVQPRRIAGYSIGWHGNTYPEFPGPTKSLFLFDPEGALLAIPVVRRARTGAEDRYSTEEPTVTPVAQLSRVLASLPQNIESNNTPLTEEQENRLAWLGVELQAMTQELARANSVSDQTNDGDTGALVTFVYPESPAAKAGVEQGWVLLRIDVAAQPKPIDVRVDQDRFGGQQFPWDRLDGASEQIFDRIPTPWPDVENSLIRSLTDLGFGTKYVAEFYHDGKVDKKEFAVTQGPASYASAAKYKHIGLGVTVRNLTYEVRRYMQKKDEDPGVVIGKIEMGSKASIAGLKPYEVITHVNDQPVLNVQDFERLAKDQTELRLSVQRMTKGRIVKITLSPRSAAPGQDQPAASQPE
jgi:S1-C subfamily serine protease